MYLTPSNGAVWKSWPDFSPWNREELVDSRPDAESLRTRQPCYPARKMKVEKRKFGQALTKMLRAKPEPHLVRCPNYNSILFHGFGAPTASIFTNSRRSRGPSNSQKKMPCHR